MGEFRTQESADEEPLADQHRHFEMDLALFEIRPSGGESDGRHQQRQLGALRLVLGEAEQKDQRRDNDDIASDPNQSAKHSRRHT